MLENVKKQNSYVKIPSTININKNDFQSTEDNDQFNEKKRKFDCLQEKLNNLLKEEINHKISKIEKKLNQSQRSFKSICESLDSKYQILQQYTTKLKLILEEEKHKKNLVKDVLIQNIKLLHKNVQNKINSNNEALKNKTLDYVKALEYSVSQISQQYVGDKSTVNQLLEEIREVVSNDIPALDEKIDSECKEKSQTISSISSFIVERTELIKKQVDFSQEERKLCEDGFLVKFNEVIENSNVEFEKEVEKREKFEKNIFALLKETQENIYLRNSES